MPPPVGYLQAHDLTRLLDFLGQRQAAYGECLTFHLAAALFYTCSRSTEIASLHWSDCLLSGTGQITGLRINDQGKNLREVQEALRHRDIRTTSRYTHVAPEHTRGTMDALGGS